MAGRSLIPGQPLRGFVQVAGVHDPEEALILTRAGVDAIGFPLRLPVHAPDCTEAEAARIIAGLPRTVASVCITYEEDPAELIRLCRFLGVSGLQLHGRASPSCLAAVRRKAPELFLIKSLVVGRDSADEMEAALAAYAPHAHAFLTDTHCPATGADGATGIPHDWETSRRLARLSSRPLILAGGLDPDNVSLAVARVRPAGVDAHTRLEGPDGRKDPELTRRFVTAARSALASPLGVLNSINMLQA